MTGEELAVPHAFRFRQFDHAGRLADAELRARPGQLVVELGECSYAMPVLGV